MAISGMTLLPTMIIWLVLLLSGNTEACQFRAPEHLVNNWKRGHAAIAIARLARSRTQYVQSPVVPSTWTGRLRIQKTRLPFIRSSRSRVVCWSRLPFGAGGYTGQ